MSAQKDTGAEGVSNDISTALDRAGCPVTVKRDVLARTWTMDQIPPIKNEGQASIYRDAAKQLWLKCSSGGDGFVAFAQSQEGMLANAFDARVLEWEGSGN